MTAELEIDYPLLPDEDEGVDVDADLAAAIASVLDDPVPLPGTAPEAYGRTWDLDFAARRFRRQGRAPAALTGLASLDVWCEMAVRTARYAHSAFTDEFGMERPEDLLGEADVGERVGDFEQRLTDALLVHDRIVAVIDFDSDYDPATGILTTAFARVTDDEQRLPFGPVRVDTAS